MTPELPSLAQAVGRRIADLRREAKPVLRAEDIAAAAREIGLDWTRPAVAALESGRRRLDAEELLLLPAVMALALGRSVSLDDLLPARATIGGTTADPRRLLREPATGSTAKTLSSRRTTRAGETTGEALVKAARSLGVSISDLLRAAEAQFGHSLLNEREKRVRERARHWPSQTPLMDDHDALRAVRGHIMRQILKELYPQPGKDI